VQLFASGHGWRLAGTAASSVKYSLLVGDPRVDIDEDSGLISVNDQGTFDFEQATNFSLTVQATDQGTPSLSTTAEARRYALF